MEGSVDAAIDERGAKLQAILAERNLAVCYRTNEHTCDLDNISEGYPNPELLGIFPYGVMRFHCKSILVKDREHTDTYYEILHLCPQHFPKRPNFSKPYGWVGRDVIIQDNQFYSP